MKSVQIPSFSGPYFPTFGLNAWKCGPEKLRIRTLCTQWLKANFEDDPLMPGYVQPSQLLQQLLQFLSNVKRSQMKKKKIKKQMWTNNGIFSQYFISWPFPVCKTFWFLIIKNELQEKFRNCFVNSSRFRCDLNVVSFILSLVYFCGKFFPGEFSLNTFFQISNENKKIKPKGWLYGRKRSGRKKNS